jgi:hypothetical protein
MRNKIIFFLTVLLIIFVGGYFFVLKEKPASESVENNNDIAANIYKSASCACCLGHAGYLRGKGFSVETIVENDMDSIKKRYSIPYDMQSCHTTEIEGYFVEGHVPIEAINKLLSEKPDIDGITLPDMPAGSPGMPGLKKEEFIIYSLKDGQEEEFMRI